MSTLLDDVANKGPGSGPERGTHEVGGAPDPAPTPTAPDDLAPPALRFRTLIDDAPIVGFTGANGAGKTLVAVSECVRDMSRGRIVVSTVPIVSPWGSSVPLLSLRQLLDVRDSTVLLDEVSVLFSSRGTGSLPDEVQVFLQTLRHHAVTVRWTAPAWARADIMLREVTQVAVSVTGMLTYTRPGSFWPTPRLVMAGALDCVGIGTDAKPEKILRRRVYRPRRLPGWGAYDSESDIARIGWALDSGRCVDCGGRKRPAMCTPERHGELGLKGGGS